MATFIYCCPRNGHRVQGWFPDNDTPHGAESYESLTCTACGQVHFVNERTGRVLDQGPFRTCLMKGRGERT